LFVVEKRRFDSFDLATFHGRPLVCGSLPNVGFNCTSSHDASNHSATNREYFIEHLPAFFVSERTKQLGCFSSPFRCADIHTSEYARFEFAHATLCEYCHTCTGTTIGCIACRFLLGTQLARAASVVSLLAELAYLAFRA
jgi:hypothetical protein